MIQATTNKFYENGYWSVPLGEPIGVSDRFMLQLFDQDGYRLTLLEALYSEANKQRYNMFAQQRVVMKPWHEEIEYKTTGAVLNHSVLLERKGYEGEAKEELERWARNNNLLYKLLRYKPKWGVDFSMDYVNQEGVAMEILHYEYDSHNLEEIYTIKDKAEKILGGIDWEDAGKKLLERREEWGGLDAFQQSDWKCKYFGLKTDSKSFKMVAWEG